MNQRIKFGRLIDINDKENDKLTFFNSPKKRVRFDESANQIWIVIDKMIKKMTS